MRDRKVSRKLCSAPLLILHTTPTPPHPQCVLDWNLDLSCGTITLTKQLTSLHTQWVQVYCWSLLHTVVKLYTGNLRICHLTLWSDFTNVWLMKSGVYENAVKGKSVIVTAHTGPDLQLQVHTHHQWHAQLWTTGSTTPTLSIYETLKW